VGLSNLPGLWALTFLTVVPMLPVQAELNRYWTSELPTARMRLRYTPAEMVVMALGAGMLMVFLASLASGV
jgi:hypothetical protein